MIKFFGLDRQYSCLKDEILSASDKVYSSGQMMDGHYTKCFENMMASRTNRGFAIAVNSCSMALFITYLYYSNYSNAKSNNVAIPAISFIATNKAPELANLNIKYTDVNSNGLLNIDKLELREDNIGIISYVNLYGNVLDYDKLFVSSQFFDKDIIIIEDAAQSFGAYYKGIPSGKLGHASCLSFDPTKNLPNYGSGGMILTDNIDLCGFARKFRNNGIGGVINTAAATNCRMSEADCAQMIVKLKYFDDWQQRRAEIANYYTNELSQYVSCLGPNDDVTHAWHKFVIQTFHRDSMQTYLKGKDVETKIHYSNPLPMESSYTSEYLEKFAVARAVSETSLSLPIYPELLDSEVEYIVDNIKNFYK